MTRAASPRWAASRAETPGASPRVPSPPWPALGVAGPLGGAAPCFAEADSLFAQVLEGVGEADSQTEDYLRRCLALDPDLSAARYLLAMLLELREAFAEAAAEYRRPCAPWRRAGRATRPSSSTTPGSGWPARRPSSGWRAGAAPLTAGWPTGRARRTGRAGDLAVRCAPL